MPSKLGTVPLVRRIVYLETYLKGVQEGLTKEDIESELVGKKKELEYEKNLALGRGKTSGRRISGAAYLLRYCFRLSRDLGFIFIGGSQNQISDKGVYFIESKTLERKRVLAEAYSEAYPHLSVLIRVLLKEGGMITLPMEKRSFDSKAECFGLRMSQVVFDSVRDITTYIGLINWRISGSGADRVLIVYLTSNIVANTDSSYEVRIFDDNKWKNFQPNEVHRGGFRDALWESYLNIAGGVPGAPTFYSEVREEVCHLLGITDDQFDKEIMDMINGDEVLRIHGSEGFLPYRKDSAGMLKSLPPKNVWGDYIVYLRIERN